MYEHSAILFDAMNYLLKKLNIYEQMITPHKIVIIFVNTILCLNTFIEFVYIQVYLLKIMHSYSHSYDHKSYILFESTTNSMIGWILQFQFTIANALQNDV